MERLPRGGGTVLAAHDGSGRRHSHEQSLWHRPGETPRTVIFVDTSALLALVDELLPDAVAVTE